MEIMINGKQFVFKDELTVDEFIQIGLPPTQLMRGFKMADIDSETFIKIIEYQKELMGVLCLQPKEENLFGKMSIASMNKLASDPLFLKLMGKVMGGDTSGEEPEHQTKPTI